MLCILDSNRAKLKSAAALVNMERELSSLVSYYPIIDRMLTKIADALDDLGQISIVIRNAMQRIERCKRLVAITNDSLRAVHFIQSLMDSMAECALYFFWHRQEGLKVFSNPPTMKSTSEPWQRIDSSHPIFIKLTTSEAPSQWSNWSN